LELPELSDDRLMQILQTLAVLLFVSVGALSLGRARYAWVKWARWGAVAVFSVAFLYALGVTVRWALGAETG
jgi:membrane protein YdbS with pleckstrin-like domain